MEAGRHPDGQVDDGDRVAGEVLRGDDDPLGPAGMYTPQPYSAQAQQPRQD